MNKTVGLVLILLSTVARAAIFDDITAVGGDIYAGTPETHHLLYDSDKSLRSAGDIHAATDAYIGRDLQVGRDLSVPRSVTITQATEPTRKVIRVVVLPTSTYTPTPTNTFATSTPTPTPTGTWYTPTNTPTGTITPTFTPLPTNDVFWVRGNGDVRMAGDLVSVDSIILPGDDPTPAPNQVMLSVRVLNTPVLEVNAEGDLTMSGELSAGGIAGEDFYVDHLIIPGDDPTPAANEVMISVQADTTPVFEVDAEGDVDAAGDLIGADFTADHLTIPGDDPTPAADEVMLSVQADTTPVFEVDAEGDVDAAGNVSASDVAGDDFTADHLTIPGNAPTPAADEVMLSVQADTTPVFEVDAEGDVDAAGNVSASDVAGDDFTADHLTIPGNAPTPAADEVMLSVQADTTPVFEVDAEGDVDAAGNVSASDVAGDDFTADHLTIPGNAPTPAADEVMLSVQADSTPVFEVDAEGDVTASGDFTAQNISAEGYLIVGQPTPVKITLGAGKVVIQGEVELQNLLYLLQNLTLDKDNGDSPIIWLRSGDDQNIGIVKRDGGWAEFNVSVSSAGAHFPQNLMVGTTTAQEISLNGGELVVQGKSEFQDDLHALDYLIVHSTPTPIITVGQGDASVGGDLGVSGSGTFGADMNLYANLAFQTADAKLTQPEDSSGIGPLHWEFDGITTNYLSGSLGEGNFAIEPLSTPSDNVWMGLPIPVEVPGGGTVVIHAITVFGDDDDNAAYIDGINIVQNDGDESSTLVAQYTTDIGNGTTGLWNQQILSADINRATYPGPLRLYVECRSMTATGDLSVCKVVIEAHTE